MLTIDARCWARIAQLEGALLVARDTLAKLAVTGAAADNARYVCDAALRLTDDPK